MTNFRTKLLKAAALTKAHPSHPLQPCTSNTGCQNINTWKTKRKLQSAELNSLANVCRVTTTVNFFINYNICWDNTIMKRYILVLCWYNLIRSFKVQECGFTVCHWKTTVSAAPHNTTGVTPGSRVQQLNLSTRFRGTYRSWRHSKNVEDNLEKDIKYSYFIIIFINLVLLNKSKVTSKKCLPPNRLHTKHLIQNIS